MASPKLIIVFAFLLAALELARGAGPTCQTREDCYEKLICPEAETLVCENGECVCVIQSLIEADAPNTLPEDDGFPTCQEDKDCKLLIACIDATIRCSEGKCRCIKDDNI
ncbi:hypothetical protein SASPL_130496 [Salvia splendens]|uniref:Uncharacterized protein n=1 Tax=Salvia splendens TaxID=180675 RepID=A0A8X8X4B3_SALSN|nr:uncharacterized protein LOC121755498 [Salvia splendens]KAG6407505.1 hypothetical protein SASPL_130496 [Salvia splendens]